MQIIVTYYPIIIVAIYAVELQQLLIDSSSVSSAVKNPPNTADRSEGKVAYGRTRL